MFVLNFFPLHCFVILFICDQWRAAGSMKVQFKKWFRVCSRSKVPVSSKSILLFQVWGGDQHSFIFLHQSSIFKWFSVSGALILNPGSRGQTTLHVQYVHLLQHTWMNSWNSFSRTWWQTAELIYFLNRKWLSKGT